MFELVQRTSLAAGAFIALTGQALADVKPDPTDPTGPFGIVLAALALAAGVGYLFYRRRNK